MAGVAGLVGLALLAWATLQYLIANALYEYGFQWFMKLGPGEPTLFFLHALGGGAVVAALGWGLSALPLRFPAGRGAVLGAALVASGVTAAIGFGVLGDQVVTDDEYVYLFQARTWLEGRPYAPAPELPDFHTNVFVVTHDVGTADEPDLRWFGQYPPGHPLLLAPFVALGAPRLLPVLLAALNVLLFAAIMREVTEPRWAVVGAWLLATSPLFLLTGATLLSHPSALIALQTGTWAALRSRRSPAVGWGLLVGAAVGLLVLVRPWTGVTLGLLPGGLLLVGTWRARRFGPAVAAVAALVVAAGVFLAANQAVSGSLWETGYDAVRGADKKEFGFGTVFPGIHDHTPIQGLRNVWVLLVRFHTWVLGWPLVALAWVLALRTAPGDQRAQRVARVALLVLVLGLLTYVPYWSVGVNDTGPVKTYELLLPGVALAVLGVRRFAARSPGGAAGVVVAAMLVAAAVFWPGQLRHLSELRETVRAPLAAVEETVEPPALVFVLNMQTRPASSWVFGRPNPRPDLSDPVLYVRDLGGRNPGFARIHPGRRSYQLVHDGDRFHVVPFGRGGRR